MRIFQITIIEKNGDRPTASLPIDSCVAAGYTGRNQQAVQAHINELQKLGVATPYAVPAMYWISPTRITDGEKIVVVGRQTSPEVEFFMAYDDTGQGYVTVASDHTDRALETVSVSKSKQVCDKVVGDVFWRLHDVENHWDDIEIASQVRKNGEWREYQKGSLGDIMHHEELLHRISAEKPAGKAPGIFSGTVPLIGGDPEYTTGCKIIMHDPQLGRKIIKEYQIITLPDRS